jgi:hypothetical protein
MASAYSSKPDRNGRGDDGNGGGHDAADTAADGEPTWSADGWPPSLADQFLRHVEEYEKAPSTTHFIQLREAGVVLPAPQALTGRRLKAKLWELIEHLGRLRVFLCNTDHLSDRALYTRLWAESLHEPVAALPLDDHFSWHIDLIGSGSDEDIYLNLKYYADEEWRRDWAEHFPAEAIPPHEDPPYDRDRHLPRATYGGGPA